MLCGGPAYPATCRPEDVLATVRHNQMEYFYGDVLLRGKIPGYALRYFKDNGWKIQISPAEEEKLTHHCDFSAFPIITPGCVIRRILNKATKCSAIRSFPLIHGVGR